MFKDDRMMSILSGAIFMVAIGTVVQNSEQLGELMAGTRVDPTLKDDSLEAVGNDLVRIDVLANDEGLRNPAQRLVITRAPDCGRAFVQDGAIQFFATKSCETSTFEYGLRDSSLTPATVAVRMRSELAQKDNRGTPPSAQVGSDGRPVVSLLTHEPDVATRAPGPPTAPGGAPAGPAVVADASVDAVARGGTAPAGLIAAAEDAAPPRGAALPGAPAPMAAPGAPVASSTDTPDTALAAGPDAVAAAAPPATRPRGAAAMDAPAGAPVLAAADLRIAPPPELSTAIAGQDAGHPALPRGEASRPALGAPAGLGSVAAFEDEALAPLIPDGLRPAASPKEQRLNFMAPLPETPAFTVGAAPSAAPIARAPGGMTPSLALARIDRPAAPGIVEPAPGGAAADSTAARPLPADIGADDAGIEVGGIEVAVAKNLPPAIVRPAPVEPAGERVASLTPAAETCALPPSLTLDIGRGALTVVEIESPCHAESVARLDYGELSLGVALGEDGRGRIEVPGFADSMEATLVFADGTDLPFTLAFQEAGKVERVAILWDAPVALDLYAIGSRGEVGPATPGSFREVRRDGGGFLTSFDPVDGTGQSVRVYTHYLRPGAPTGIVRMAIDFSSRREAVDGTCGAGDLASPAFTVLRSTKGEADRPMQGQLAAVDCDDGGQRAALIEDAIGNLVITN